MAKKSSIERNNKRKALSNHFNDRRTLLKNQFYRALSLEEKCLIHRKLQALPRNSAPNRIYRRCFVTGRPRSIYRDFGLSRHVLREMAHNCLLPGVTKSSW